jgi:hypothetical protein
MLPSATPPDPASEAGQDLIKRGRVIRQQAGVGFGAMARQLGIAKSTLSRYETTGPAAARPGGWDIPAYWVAILAALDRSPRVTGSAAAAPAARPGGGSAPATSGRT